MLTHEQNGVVRIITLMAFCAKAENKAFSKVVLANDNRDMDVFHTFLEISHKYLSKRIG